MTERYMHDQMSARRFNALERNFAPYQEPVSRFAREKGLEVEKYYHDFPAWFIGRTQRVEDNDVMWWNIQFGYDTKHGRFELVTSAWMDREYTTEEGRVRERRLVEPAAVIATWARGHQVDMNAMLEEAYQRATTYTEQDLNKVSASITGHDGVTRSYNPGQAA